MHNYTNYGWLRGFNIIPSWGATIEQAWTDYDPARFREEVALARSVHANTIRLWIEFSAWMLDPEVIRERFMDAIAAIDAAGMKVMPCLFNRWHDIQFDYGGTYPHQWANHGRSPFPGIEQHVAYVRHLAEPLRDDPRILIWDLCNEPQTTSSEKRDGLQELHWLARMADVLRRCGIRQPVTIGTMQNYNVEVFAPLCDVLCIHPYARKEEDLDAMITVAQEMAVRHGKPMLSNETVPGALDDAARAACARWTIAKMEDAGFGWMGWGMRAGKAISTRRDRYDPNGLNQEGFHAWFNADGSLRSGLEFLYEKPRFAAPWEA